MKNYLRFCALAAIGFGLSLSAASAAVITGPALDQSDTFWTVSGLEFKALDNSTLTSFTFHNQGLADTVILTDAAGNILHSTATPSSVASDLLDVSWSLTAGNNYFLLQQTQNNGRFTDFNSALPSDADISIAVSGTFDTSISAAISVAPGSNEYWFDFTGITTSSAVVTGVPEPLTLSLFGAGLAGAVMLRRRKK